ncbi:hypothetical protein [Pseudomonas migulae]|uniref:Lipoprotein n=1 Tax=Pseudomonas migulae TaxID=78543 RepID=A0ABY8MYU5_9PSED|nr:hypothetical protein [Pseudomonas migulae]WGK92574.1 hypothetical protein MOQ58_10435 [Pseudomonas migulae]
MKNAVAIFSFVLAGCSQIGLTNQEPCMSTIYGGEDLGCVEKWEAKNGREYFKVFHPDAYWQSRALNDQLKKNQILGLGGTSCVAGEVNREQVTEIISDVLESYGFKKEDIGAADTTRQDGGAKQLTIKEKWDQHEKEVRKREDSLPAWSGASAQQKERLREEKKLCIEHNQCPWN